MGSDLSSFLQSKHCPLRVGSPCRAQLASPGADPVVGLTNKSDNYTQEQPTVKVAFEGCPGDPSAQLYLCAPTLLYGSRRNSPSEHEVNTTRSKES